MMDGKCGKKNRQGHLKDKTDTKKQKTKMKTERINGRVSYFTVSDSGAKKSNVSNVQKVSRPKFKHKHTLSGETPSINHQPSFVYAEFCHKVSRFIHLL